MSATVDVQEFSELASTSKVPRETMPRFMLAMIAILIASVAVAESLWFSVYSENALRLLALCGEGQPEHLCQAELRDRVAWTAGFMPFVAGLSVIGAGLASWARRRHLSPLPTMDLPAIAAMNQNVAIGAQTSIAPLVWRPDRPVSTARADGLVHRYLEVGPGWLALAMSDPQRASAILRHEYSHHRNRDVIPARVIMAASAVFVALIAWLLLAFRNDGLQVLAAAIVRGLVLLAIVALSRASILRARELDADASVGIHEAAGLRRALTPERAVAASATSQLMGLVAHHPSPMRRLAVVNDPGLLRKPQLADAALVGLSAGVAAPVLSRLLNDLLRGSNLASYSAGISWGLVGLVVGCWLTVLMWRVVGDTDLGAHTPQLLPFGATLGAGLLMANAVFTFPLTISSVPLPTHTIDLLTSVMMGIAVPVWLIWVLQLLSQVHHRSPDASLFRGVGGVAGLISILNIGALLGFLGFVHTQAVLFGANPDLAVLFGLDPDLPTTLVLLAMLWNESWMGYAIPTLAVIGSLYFIRKSNLRQALAVSAVAATLGTTLLWAVRTQLDIATAVSQGDSVASLQIALSSPAIVGTTIAAAITMSVVRVRQGRVVLSAGLAVIASLMGAILVEALLLDGPGDVWVLAAGIAPWAVIGSMSFAALSGYGLPSLKRQAGVGMLGALATASLVLTTLSFA